MLKLLASTSSPGRLRKSLLVLLVIDCQNLRVSLTLAVTAAAGGGGLTGLSWDTRFGAPPDDSRSKKDRLVFVSDVSIGWQLALLLLLLIESNRSLLSCGDSSNRRRRSDTE